MAILDISEYPELARDIQTTILQAGQEPAITHQQVAVAGSTAQSSAFGSETQFVRLHSDVPCRVEFGVNPVAAATSKRLAANATEYFGVVPGQKVAVILTT
jgi:hypothetical protein